MFKFINGVITSQTNNSIELTVNNIGYEIFIPKPKLLKLNSTYKIYVCDLMNEESIFLYGFLSLNELELFKKIISINGFGPKKALQILSNVTYEELIYLITIKDVTKIKKIPGINSNAELFLSSMNKKIGQINTISSFSNVYDALISLGYKHDEINGLINNLDLSLSEECLLKEALKRLAIR